VVKKKVGWVLRWGEFEKGMLGRLEERARCGEASAALEVALPRAVKALASLILLFMCILESAPRKQTQQRLDTG